MRRFRGVFAAGRHRQASTVDFSGTSPSTSWSRAHHATTNRRANGQSVHNVTLEPLWLCCSDFCRMKSSCTATQYGRDSCLPVASAMLFDAGPAL
jgi:hypothetical protein